MKSYARTLLIAVSTANLAVFAPQLANAFEQQVTAEAPLSTRLDLQAGTSFDIENSNGSIEIYETEESQMTIEAKYIGQGKAIVRASQQQQGNVRIEVEYIRPTQESDVAAGSTKSAVNRTQSIHGVTFGRSSTIVTSGQASPVISNVYGSVNISGNVVVTNGISVGSDSGSLKLSIGIPASLLGDLKMQSSNGPLSIQGLSRASDAKTRTVDLFTENGNITIKGLQRSQLTAQTTNGNVLLSNTVGSAEITTDNGNVMALSHTGNIRARSANGDVALHEQRDGRADVHSQNGRVVKD